MNDLDETHSTAPPTVTLQQSFLYWLKLGFVSFGGPAGQISIMHQELVEKRRWISERRFLHALNYCMVLPGPEAQQLATYIGWLMHGSWGGIMAGGLFVLPSLFILIFLSWIYMAFGNLLVVAGILYGIKPAITAIVVFAAYRIGSRALKNSLLWAISASAFIAVFAFDVPFPYIVLSAGLIGYVGGHISPEKFEVGGNNHQSKDVNFGPALISDTSPAPTHTRFQWSRLILFATVGLGLWLGGIVLCLAQYGWEGTITQMAWFFTKAALLTFGGAYAVLPYVYQGAVEQYHWLTPTQMIDGLALGETTPGPLIMVVAFVGFVGGWSKAALGSSALFASGTLGATVATFFTFLPSFLFIVIGGPLVERTHGDLKFTSPLTGITAAVVGVILNLSVFFAWHVLWPDGFNGAFEWTSAVITVAGLVALFRYKMQVIPLIGACGVVGLIYTLIKAL